MGENMSRTALLADQIRRAFDGEAWHGDSVLEILKGIKAAQAAARPIKNAHSIWEIVGHIAAWDAAVMTRTGGQAATVSDQDNFPAVKDASEAAWRKAVEHLVQVHTDLVKAVANFPDSRLQEPVPGKREPYYNYYYMFSGIVQHELYHAGQAAILKKAL